MGETLDQVRVGARMQAAAEAKGLQAYDVAHQVGVRAPTIYRWYKGLTRPSNEFMNRFAALVERSATYLWTGQETLEEGLLRWAAAARTGGGRAALEALSPGGSSEALLALVEEQAPAMLAMLRALGGAELPARWEEPGLPAGLKRELVRHLIDHVPVTIIQGPRHRTGQVGVVVWQDWVAELD